MHQIQVVELRQLLDKAQDDPVMGPQLRSRLEDAERAVAEEIAHPTTALPRTAIFMRGGGVVGSEGIRPTLAGEALIRYEKMFMEQALHDEREMAKNAGRSRRPRGSTAPGLLFTGTPRGSFGLEFVPQETENPVEREARARALTEVTEALVRVATRESSAHEEAVSHIPPSVLQPMKQFMKTLAQHSAELRLAFDDRPAESLSTAQIATAVERLEREVTQETVDLQGEFRGVTLVSGFFDFLTADGELITGTVSEDMTEEELTAILDLTNRRCKATFQKTTVRRVPNYEKMTFVLLGAAVTSV
ncbi:MAG: hypothetical protein J2P46_04705 [Zavarzinella sp.]|nr:hypothetical protein [Zavarzinella sp.]